MLDIKLLRDQIDLVRRGTLDKGYDVKIVDLAVELDKNIAS